MNDADIDRTLRAWLEAGTDRAPERFVWSAIDDIETVPQRAPWVTTLEGAVRPLMPFARVVAVAAVVVVAVSLFLALGPANEDQVGGPAPFETRDLTGIVVWDDTAPPTWTLDSLITTPADVLTIPVRSMDGEAWQAQDELEEYLGGRYTDFSGDDAVYVSWAVVFRTDRAAGEAFELYRRDLASPNGWGLDSEERVALGEEALLLSGETTALMGAGGDESVPMQIYLWRTGNLLMATAGWFDFDPRELEAVAQDMDGRAQRIAGRE
jgi:hypothetical protein